MKKLLTIILIMAMLLPAAALAADPIVGCWYLHADLKANPELKSSFGDNDSITDLYFFNEDGTISALEGIVKDGSCTPSFNAFGKWEKALFSYNVSMIGLGNTTMTVNGDEAYLQIPGSDYKLSMKLRRLVNFDPYNDYKF